MKMSDYAPGLVDHRASSRALPRESIITKSLRERERDVSRINAVKTAFIL
jgi:hypothetical protein